MNIYTKIYVYVLICMFSFCINNVNAQDETIALWLFDEQQQLYPGCALSESSDNNYVLILGPFGRVTQGKFGNALEPGLNHQPDYPTGSAKFGLEAVPIPSDRSIEPLVWKNARYCALMTSGENHLRKEISFANPTQTDLNLGDFDWTIEFWYQHSGEQNPGVVFEIGSGPRGENEQITRFSYNPVHNYFLLFNKPGQIRLKIPTAAQLSERWHHIAFVFDSGSKQLSHYVNGKIQPLPEKCQIRALTTGEEDYFCIGTNGIWQDPLPGRLDELRFSKGVIYSAEFNPPQSLAKSYQLREGVDTFTTGLPLLFTGQGQSKKPLNIGGRKYLFIDDAIVETAENIHFEVHPPRLAEKVIDNITGPFRKHLNVIEDENGLIRLYNGIHDDYLSVRTSTDGIHWEIPDLKRPPYKGQTNIVIPEPTAMGNVFIDPNAPAERRWKYVSGFNEQGIYLYTSADGWFFKRHKTAVLPFRSGSQSNVFYDDQRQLYVGYHRSDCVASPAMATLRTFVMTEVKDILSPWPFRPVYATSHERFKLKNPQPFYLDNGPLTPCGLCMEYPVVFAPDEQDPVGTDIYVPKAEKYAWAPDTYLAFPIVYFHYKKDGPQTRQILAHPDRKRGSGPLETQLAVSRNGIDWKRYPRPTYVGIGNHSGANIHQAYLAHGMIRRGDEIWQYYFGTEIYHSTYSKKKTGDAVYRLVQRLDGFVSASAPYDKTALIVTKPLIFKGNRLLLNIDTDATGYAQVGLTDMYGKAIPGFGPDQCIYINGDYTDTEVEWLEKGFDVSEVAGKEIRIVIQMRGARLFAMQFQE